MPRRTSMRLFWFIAVSVLIGTLAVDLWLWNESEKHEDRARSALDEFDSLGRKHFGRQWRRIFGGQDWHADKDGVLAALPPEIRAAHDRSDEEDRARAQFAEYGEWGVRAIAIEVLILVVALTVRWRRKRFERKAAIQVESPPKKRRWGRRILILALILAVLGGAAFAHRECSIHQVEKTTDKFDNWVAHRVMEPNHLKLVDAFGRYEPAWMGMTNRHVVFIAPDKSQINVDILIESDLFGTRINTTAQLTFQLP